MKNCYIENKKENAKALNDLARHQMILRLMKDIRIDIEVCKIEGWDCMEYINLLKKEIDRFAEQNKNAQKTT